jgi:hypothetical protein
MGIASHASRVAPALPKPPKLGDDQNLSAVTGNLTSWINDSVSPTLFGAGGSRGYWVNLTTSGLPRNQSVELQSEPSFGWSGARQMPEGADNLPPVLDWTWWVIAGNGTPDSANWSADADGLHLDRIVPWSNASFEILGVSSPGVAIGVDPNATNGLSATGTGFVVNAPGYVDSLPPSPGYAALTGSIHPTLLRISLGLAGQISSWNASTGHATFNFSGLDAQFQLAEEDGAQVLLSLPAGTFGDGNELPNGTPLNRSVLVQLAASSGYFAAPSAYYSIVRDVANHTYSLAEPVTYWSIGNEVVLGPANETEAYAAVINAAIDALSPHYPEARVGTDDMMDARYLPTFAALAPRVGFLSLHYYPSWGLCQTPSGDYCPPSGGGLGSPTPTLFARPAFVGGANRLTPQAATSEWFNATGQHLPVLVTETNLAYVGGPGAPNQALGTDPRIQSLVGAAWLGSFLIDTSADNVSAITYFGFTSGANLTDTLTYHFGGFGFGLTNESANGTVTRYAPYWAMRLWGSYLPAGSAALLVNDSDPSVISAWAVRNGSDVDVAVVDQVASNVSVHLHLGSSLAVNRTYLLDQTTYREAYDPVTNSTSVLASGVRTDLAPRSANLTIHGYGMAVAVFSPRMVGNGSGPGGSGGSGGNGSGNNSGNNSGNGSGPSGGSGAGGNNSSSGSPNGTSNQSSSGNSSQNRSNGNGSSGGPPDHGTETSTNNSSTGGAGRPPGATPAHALLPGDPYASVGGGLAGLQRTPASTLLGVATTIALAGVAVGAYAAFRREGSY